MKKQYVIQTIDEVDPPDEGVIDELEIEDGEIIKVFSSKLGAELIDWFYWAEGSAEGRILDAAPALRDALQDAIPILVWAASKHVTGAREALGAARAALASADGGEQ